MIMQNPIVFELGAIKFPSLIGINMAPFAYAALWNAILTLVKSKGHISKSNMKSASGWLGAPLNQLENYQNNIFAIEQGGANNTKL